MWTDYTIKTFAQRISIRIAGAEIYTQNTFYIRSKRRYWEEEEGGVGGYFHLWDVYWKGDRLPDGRVAESIYLWLNEPFLLSLNAFYLKPLDYEYYRGLKSPIAQRLYELLGLKFYGLRDSRYVRYRYRRLCQLLPLAPQGHLKGEAAAGSGPSPPYANGLPPAGGVGGA